jgi:hypothetical protein
MIYTEGYHDKRRAFLKALEEFKDEASDSLAFYTDNGIKGDAEAWNRLERRVKMMEVLERAFS